jgi:hypothetical protein
MNTTTRKLNVESFTFIATHSKKKMIKIKPFTSQISDLSPDVLNDIA